MEVNSNNKDITYQLNAIAYSMFNSEEKKAFMDMLNSIIEK